jgi:hypothetical protein
MLFIMPRCSFVSYQYNQTTAKVFVLFLIYGITLSVEKMGTPDDFKLLMDFSNRKLQVYY